MLSIGVVAATLALLVSTIATLPAVSAAIDWRPEVVIARTDAGRIVAGASYGGGLAAIAWRIATDTQGTLRLAIAADAGREAFSTRVVAQRVDSMAVSACGTATLVAYRERLPDGRRRLRLARVPADGGTIARAMIRRSVPAGGSLDVACGSRRATVAWTERTGSDWHAFVRHALLDGSARTRSQDLGAARRERVAVAASGDRAYVAWSDAHGIRLARFIIGAAPDSPVTGRRARMVAPYGRAPMLAAAGSRLLLGFSDPFDVELRLSKDGGATFPMGTGFAPDPGEVSVLSLGLGGPRVVATLRYTTGASDPSFYRMLAGRFGAAWDISLIGGRRSAPIDGFLVTGIGTRLAETFVRHEPGQDAWELVFRRQA